MMNDKQLLQMIEKLGSSRKVNSLSLGASEISETDTKCAKTLRNIIENSGTSTKSLAVECIPSPNPNVNRVKVPTQFIFRNGKI